MLLETAPDYCKKDQQIVGAACSQNPSAIQFVDYDLQAIYLHYVVSAINKDEEMYNKIHPRIRGEIERILEELSEQPEKAFTEMNYKFRGLKKIALAAVISDGLLLNELINDLNDDYEVVLEAVRENPMALEFASSRLKDDESIVLTAISLNPNALKFASQRLKNDENFIIKGIMIDPFCIIHATTNIKRIIFQDLNENHIRLIEFLIKIYLKTHESIIPKSVRLQVFRNLINMSDDEIKNIIENELSSSETRYLPESNSTDDKVKIKG